MVGLFKLGLRWPVPMVSRQPCIISPALVTLQMAVPPKSPPTPAEKRKAEAARIKEKYPDRIPVSRTSRVQGAGVMVSSSCPLQKESRVSGLHGKRRQQVGISGRWWWY